MYNNNVITEVTGNKKVMVDGCDSIIDFDDENIILKSGRLKIAILGKELKIKILMEQTAIVEGFIMSVSYSYT